MVKAKTIEEITRRITAGKAVILTGDELNKMTKSGEKVKWDDIDVVTSATCGLMSGTIAVLSFPQTGVGGYYNTS